MIGLKSRLAIQERDIALLRSLFESRVMTSAHVAMLFFDGKKEAAKKRLQALKRAEFIGERRRAVSEPAILFPTMKALRFLREQGVIQEYSGFSWQSLQRRSRVSDLTLRHELEVMDVKASFHSAARQTANLKIEEFTTWPSLIEFQASRPGLEREVLVKPDGFIRIHEIAADGERYEHALFLEVDRSTEVQETLVNRSCCYIDFYRSGGFAERNGAAREDFNQYPFRVLVILKNAERRNNFAERLLQLDAPILTQVCLTTMPEVLANPFGEVWIRPVEYKDVTVGTNFDPDRKRDWSAHRRQSERETLVERFIRKISLLDDTENSPRLPPPLAGVAEGTMLS